MSLDMIDAIFMARRGVLRSSANSYDVQFAVVLLLPRDDRPTQTQSGQQRRACRSGRPQEQPSHGPTVSLPRLPRQIPARRVRTNDRRGNAGVREIQINL